MQDKSGSAEAPIQTGASSADAVVVQSHFQQTLAHQKEVAEGLKKKRLNWMVLKFISTWLFFICILVVIALLHNLEWARPRIQDAMSESFHRRVELGNLSWVLGLNGLAISTDRLSMIESDGRPFILSGQSEIGVAFLPLFSKRVIVKHVDFHRPEVFATQLAPGKWNFTDLLVEGPEIRFVQVENGRLHLRNQVTNEQLRLAHHQSIFSNTNWRSYDFEDVNVKLIFPRKKQRRPWPFYLSFKLPREHDGKRYTTDFSLTLLANGTFEDWKSKQSTIEVRADHFNPVDWRPFMNIPPGLNGMLSWTYKGEGQLNSLMQGSITCSADDLNVINSGQSLFTAKHAELRGPVNFRKNQIEWVDNLITIGGVKITAEGVVSSCNTMKPTYSAKLAADLPRLAELSETSLWKYLPGAAAKNKTDELAGAAAVEVQFEGEGDQHRVFTTVKADKIPLGNLLASDTAGGAPLLSLFEIEPNAPIKGEISIGRDQRIELRDIQIPAKGSTVKVSGFIDAQRQNHDVYVQADHLELNKFDTSELAGRPGDGSAPIDPCALMLSGKVDVKAHLKREKKQQQLEVIGNLKQATLYSAKSGPLAQSMTGTIGFDGRILRFQDIKGVLANDGVRGGNLTFNGKLDTGADGKCNLEISGHQIDVAQLISFARSAHLPVPEHAGEDMSGFARDLDVQVNGLSAHPNLTLNIAPADIAYQFRDQKQLKPLKASGGNIIVSENRLELRNVVLSTPGGKLIATACFEKRPKTSEVVPTLLHLKTSGIDIAEIARYGDADNVPADVRKTLHNAFAALNIKDVDGKAYGDVTIRVNERAPHFIEGIVGLTEASGKYGEQKLSFHGLSGMLTFVGDDVSFDQMTAIIAGGHYKFSGQLHSVQQAPTWALKLHGEAKAEQLAALIPPDVSRAGSEIGSDAPLMVQADLTNDGKSLDGTFTIQCLPRSEFYFDSPALSFHQPGKRKVVIEGGANYNFAGVNKNLELKSCKINIDDATIHGTARLSWSSDATHKPMLDFIVATPTPLPTEIALEAFAPKIDAAGATGTMKGSLAAAGEVGHLLTHGELNLNKVSVPSLRLKDVDGKIDSPRWQVSTSGSDSNSQARVFISRALIGGIDTRDARATLKMDIGPLHRIALKDGTVFVAGGRVLMHGFYVPDTSKWQLELGLDKLQVDQFVADMIEHSGELTGLADGQIVLESTADGATVSNLSGKGQISIYKGSAPRLGQLHEKLSAANLLQQGIFGFNLNNVLHSMVPVRSGKFNEVSMTFDIHKGVVDIERLHFDGDDLRLRAAGEWNIASDTIALDVAGNIPRVASSILPGAVGEATRNLTLQKAVRVLTFRKLENLPNVPILGDIGTDDPRAFTFKVAANLESADAVSRSIEKSFKWLPNKPNASAHPIPGL